MRWMILEYKTHRLWGPYESFDLAHETLEKWVKEGFVRSKEVTIKPIVGTTPETHRETQLSLLRHYSGSEVYLETVKGQRHVGYLHCDGPDHVWVSENRISIDSIYDVRWRYPSLTKLAVAS